MSFRGYILSAVAVVFGGVLLLKAMQNSVFVRQQLEAQKTAAASLPSNTEPAPNDQAARKTPVDFIAAKADTDRELNRRLGLEDRAVIMTGNVVFHHNGAVISCDSAIQHSARHIEWLGNVIINKDSTFIYADRADYNGEANLAKVFSPVIKVVDGSSTLYTYNFEFNTLDDIGRWWGGGVIYQEENTMESERGYYFSALREMVAVGNVEMKNDSHQLVGDSVRYNTLSKIATFYTPTTIWTNDGEIIDARQGRYNSADSAYFFHDHAYILTPTREIWADTIDYSALTGHALLLGNAQVVDGDPSTSSGSVTTAWGDWLEYWDKEWVDTLRGIRRQAGEAMLTRRPVIANFDAEQSADTLYIRADTFFMAVTNRRLVPDTLLATRKGAADSLSADSLTLTGEFSLLDKEGAPQAGVVDTLPLLNDTLARQLSKQDLRDRSRAVKDSLRQVRLVAKDSLTTARKAAKAEVRAEKRAKKAAVRAQKRAARAAAKAANAAEKLAVRNAKRARRGLEPLFPRRADSLSRKVGVADSLARTDSLFRADSLATKQIADSLAAARNAARAAEPQSAEQSEPDSVLRTFKGWHNVRMWRPDFSAVADSLVGFSADSTVHLYKDPLLWHGDNQIDSDSITIWSANQQISRAEFYGSPIMSMQVDEERFNQVKGRVMISHFREGALYRHDVVGNAEAVYYMQEDPPTDTTVVFDPSPIAFVALTSSEISFLIEEQTVRYIVSRKDVRAPVYPMDQIPVSEPQRLQGFRWYGERRPELADVFAREWRASQRATYDTLPRPIFPIVDRIDRRKAYLISNRMWVDRSEPLPPHAVEFREERIGTH